MYNTQDCGCIMYYTVHVHVDCICINDVLIQYVRIIIYSIHTVIHTVTYIYPYPQNNRAPRLRGRSTAPSHSHVHAFTLTHPSPSGSQRSAFTLAHTPSHSHTPRLHTHTPLAFRIASQRTTSHTADGMSLLYALRTGVLRRTRMRVQTIDLR